MKKLIKQQLREGLLKEFIGQDMVSLKRYFSMTDEEKKAYLPHDYPYLFDEFLDEEGLDSNEEGESYDIMDIIENKDPQLYAQFGEWLFDKIQNHTLNVPDADLPAWSSFDDHPILIKNQWLIHFTDNADSIYREGFKYGVNEIDRLALTTHLGQFEKEYGGFNFSYTLNDFHRYGYNGWGKYKYGKEAVIFRASGVKLWHHGDEEPQVIFYGNTATDIVPLTRGENADWAIHGGSRGILFENDSLEKVVYWFEKNYVQYRKQLRESLLLPESTSFGEYNVFHGSETKITKFVDDFVGGHDANDQEGPGIYFTTSKEQANHYGKNVYSVTLTPRLLFDQTPPNPKKLGPILTKLVKMAKDWKMSAQDYDENPSIGVNEFVKSTLEYNDSEKDCLLQVWIDFYRYNPVEFVRNCVMLGIDGIIVNKDYEDIKHIIVYNPSIINLK